MKFFAFHGTLGIYQFLVGGHCVKIKEYKGISLKKERIWITVVN